MHAEMVRRTTWQRGRIMTLDLNTATREQLAAELTRIYARDARDSEKHAELMRIGESAMSAIAEMVAACEVDFDRIEELREETAGDGEVTELAELLAKAGECIERIDAEQRIHEDPLEITYRGSWAPGETPEPEDAVILLSTGGPATRIIAALGRGGVTRAYLQVQDWGTPWTDVPCDGDVLVKYCEILGVGAEL
jgi:hypothetical protein